MESYIFYLITFLYIFSLSVKAEEIFNAEEICNDEKFSNDEIRIDNKVIISGRDYYFGQFDMVTWDEAWTKCLNLSMNLASIETEAEHNSITQYILDHPGHRNVNEQRWVWSASGVDLTYTAWREGEPSLAENTEACMDFSTTAGGWEDDPCDHVMSYMCEES